jgi:hypothetical protein
VGVGGIILINHRHHHHHHQAEVAQEAVGRCEKDDPNSGGGGDRSPVALRESRDPPTFAPALSSSLSCFSGSGQGTMQVLRTRYTTSSRAKQGAELSLSILRLPINNRSGLAYASIAQPPPNKNIFLPPSPDIETTHDRSVGVRFQVFSLASLPSRPHRMQSRLLSAGDPEESGIAAVLPLLDKVRTGGIGVLRA